MLNNRHVLHNIGLATYIGLKILSNIGYQIVGKISSVVVTYTPLWHLRSKETTGLYITYSPDHRVISSFALTTELLNICVILQKYIKRQNTWQAALKQPKPTIVSLEGVSMLFRKWDTT